MVLDTSALLAVLQDEPERRRFNEAIEALVEVLDVEPQNWDARLMLGL